jgi:PKHD-type hydroxylase
MVTNNFYFFQSVIDKETCQKIINTGLTEIQRLKEQGDKVDATVGGERDKFSQPNAIPKNELTNKQLKEKGLSEKNVYVRDSQICWLDQNWLYDIIQKYIFKANKLAGWEFDVDWNEIPQFTTYTNTGFYSWHKDGNGDWPSVYKSYVRGNTQDKLRKDGGLPENYTINKNLIGKVRKLSFTLNLTEPETYDGGNLMFDFGKHGENEFYECKEIRPQGSIVVFPSFVYHCVTPVTKGTRYSLVNWMCGAPFR